MEVRWISCRLTNVEPHDFTLIEGRGGGIPVVELDSARILDFCLKTSSIGSVLGPGRPNTNEA